MIVEVRLTDLLSPFVKRLDSDNLQKEGYAMNWDAIGALGELAGATGVVLSLVYVAVQIRDNTRSQQAATYHAMISAKNQVNLQISTSDYAPLILLKGSKDYRGLEVEERHRFNLLMRSILGVCEDIFVQYSKGFSDIQDHDINMKMVRDLLKQPGIEHWLSQNRHLFRKEFLSEIDVNA
jgi:hypothetical protein